MIENKNEVSKDLEKALQALEHTSYPLPFPSFFELFSISTNQCIEKTNIPMLAKNPEELRPVQWRW